MRGSSLRGKDLDPAEVRAATPPRKTWRFYVKLVVSLVLTSYAFFVVGWSDLLGTLRNTDLFFVALNVAISPVLILVSSLKWQVLLRSKAITVSLPRLFGLYMVGNFFNHVLPTNVGGDVIRGFKLGKHTGKREEALASVFMERLTGLTALLVFVVLALVLNVEFLGNQTLSVALAVAVLGYLGVVWLAFDRRPLAVFTNRLRARPVIALALTCRRVQDTIRSYSRARAMWLPVMTLSVVFYLLAIVNVYLGCLAFSSPVSVMSIGIAVPMILLISMTPISLGGIGIQEWGYVVVFEHLGLSGSLGLSVALLIRAKGVFIGGLGGLVYAKSLAGRE